jgi:hypothetical protein
VAKKKKKPPQLSELAPKNGTNDSHKKVKTALHLFRPLALGSSELSK